MISVCPGEIGKPSRITSPKGLESMMRSGVSVQKAQGFMNGSLSPLPDPLEPKFQTHASCDLVGVINVFSQHSRIETAGWVLTFYDVHPQLVQRFNSESFKIPQGIPVR
jgi:hypothetical protein